jgi:hypothetical protein
MLVHNWGARCVSLHAQEWKAAHNNLKNARAEIVQELRGAAKAAKQAADAAAREAAERDPALVVARLSIQHFQRNVNETLAATAMPPPRPAGKEVNKPKDEIPEAIRADSVCCNVIVSQCVHKQTNKALTFSSHERSAFYDKHTPVHNGFSHQHHTTTNHYPPTYPDCHHHHPLPPLPPTTTSAAPPLPPPTITNHYQLPLPPP